MRCRSKWLTLLIAVWAVLLGDQGFTALRLIAWSGMLVSYTREAGLSEGLQKTFSGEQPCCVCRMIKEAQGANSEPAALAASSTGLGQPERIPSSTHVGPIAAMDGRRWRQAADDPRPHSHTQEPPVPPPRHTT